MLTIHTTMIVYQACVLSTLLYGSEAWNLYSRQQHRLNAFHLRCIRRILGITWRDCMSNKKVLSKAYAPSMYALLSQRRLRWLGHVSRMQDGRIPKDVMYGELATGTRPVGRPMLRFKDVCKRDMREGNAIDPSCWEAVAADRSKWKRSVQQSIRQSEEKREELHEQKKVRRQLKSQHSSPEPTAAKYPCPKCDKKCRSKIGLFSHSRRCNLP